MRNTKGLEDVVLSRPAYFWWFLANVLAACFALISWALCLYVFGNPEVPRNYGLLKKLGRLPEHKRYTVLDAPNGDSLSPNELYGKYFGLDQEKRDKLNAHLLRNYMANFVKKPLLTYVKGDFQVMDVKKLDANSFLTQGIALRAQAMVKADDFTEAVGFPVVIDCLLPTSDSDALQRFSRGDLLELHKNPHCAAVIHVSKIVVEDEPALLLTVVPIAYGSYRIAKEKAFPIEPPSALNPAAGLPVWK